MTRPTPPVRIPAPWSHEADGWVAVNVRRARVQLEAEWVREQRQERVAQRVTAAKFYLAVAAAAVVWLMVVHP